MYKKAVSGIMLTLLLVAIFSLAINVKPAKSTWTGTVYIRADGSIDPPDAPITTYDYVTYTLTGNITSSANGIVVERDHIIIDGNGCVIQGARSKWTAGILLRERSNVIIKNTTIINFWWGIKLLHSHYNSLLGNLVIQNEAGIDLDNSHNNRLINNTASHNGFGIALYESNNNRLINNLSFGNELYGIVLDYCTNCYLRDNNMSENKYNFGVGHIYGGSVKDFIHNIDDSNVVNNKKIIYLINQENTIIDPLHFPEIGYLAVINSTNIIVQNLNLTNNMHGILICGSVNCTIRGNTIANNSEGILIGYSSRIKIVNNTANYNYRGIHIVAGCCCKLIGNVLLNNTWGIYLTYSDIESVFHNDFLNNSHQIYYRHTAINIWDAGYPSGGNYWSDYAGSDSLSGPYQNITGSDCIGDTPYIIDEYNVDNYPLMAPFSSYTITWNGETYLIDFVTNSTVSNLNFDGVEKSLSFDVMGPANTLGMCRVTIPKSLMKPSTSEKWQITVDDSPPLSTNIIEDMENTYLYFTYTHSTHKVEIRIVSEKTLLGRGWGWMRIASKQYVRGPAKLYKIEENQIELTITHQGKEYSKTWKIIWHKEYRNHELYLCYSPKNGPLIVMLQKTRWKLWLAIGKNTIAYGFPRFQRPRLMRT